MSRPDAPAGVRLQTTRLRHGQARGRRTLVRHGQARGRETRLRRALLREAAVSESDRKGNDHATEDDGAG